MCAEARQGLIVLLYVHFKEGKEDKNIANVCRFWSIRQACSKLQIDAEQSAISFRQEDRQTWSSGRDSRPQVETVQ